MDNRVYGNRGHARTAKLFAILCMMAVAIVTATSGQAAERRHSWSRSQAVSGDRLVVDPSVKTWHGMPAIRVEVRPGDTPGKGAQGTERSEFVSLRGKSGERIDESIESGEQYFGVSYKLPEDFRSAETGRGKWSIVFQLHGPDELRTSPAFALFAGANEWFLRLNTGDLKGRTQFKTIRFSDGSLNLGKWTDFIFRIKFAADDTGAVTVWRRNEGEQGFRKVAETQGIPTLQYDSSKGVPPKGHYWKQGLYRSAFDATNVLWIGPTGRGKTFDEVEGEAFGTHSGMPS